MPRIKWGLTSSKYNPIMTNTCAIDSLLSIFYYLYYNRHVREDVTIDKVSPLGLLLHHLEASKPDIACYEIARINRNFSSITITGINVNLTSSIGNWLNLFRPFLSFQSKHHIVCDGCNRKYSKMVTSNSINLPRIKLGCDKDINDRMCIISQDK